MTVVSEGVRVQSFEGFVEESLPRLVRFAMVVSGSAGDPEDLMHDALVRAGSRWPAIASRTGDAEAYLRRAIVNGHVSRWRSRRREKLVDVLPDVPIESGENHRHSEVWQAVLALPRGQRAVVALRFFEDMSIDESARMLGVSEGTVKTQTHRALHGLRRALVDEGVDEAALFASAADVGPRIVTARDASERVAGDAAALRRERIAARAAAAVAVVAAIVGILFWSPWSGVDQVQPVLPAPSVEQSSVPSSRPSPPASLGTPETPLPSVSIPTTAVPGTANAAASLALTGYSFFVERLADPPENLTSRTELDHPWPLQPCLPVTAYPTDQKRLQFAQLSTAQDTALVSALATYPDAATASEVLAGFSRAVAACGRIGELDPPVDSGLVLWSSFEPGVPADESVGFLSTTFEAPDIQPGDSFVAMRVGSVVLVVEVYRSRGIASTDTEARTRQVIQLAQNELQVLRETVNGAN